MNRGLPFTALVDPFAHEPFQRGEHLARRGQRIVRILTVGRDRPAVRLFGSHGDVPHLCGGTVGRRDPTHALLDLLHGQAGVTEDQSGRPCAPLGRRVGEEGRQRIDADTLLAGQPVTVIANNKAEGSAPLTLNKLAGAIAEALAR